MIVIQLALMVAVHAQVKPVVTLTEPGPPLATKYRLTADGERLRPALQHLLDAALTLSRP